MYLKRASKAIEDNVLKKTKEVNLRLGIRTEIDLKVYLRLNKDSTLVITETGQVGMTILTDQELINMVTNGKAVLIRDEIKI
ncbi:hypothetical protein [Lactobacillus rizhaonensis]|uniref:hypothetical protein n=1 Tax=Lactobacillus rizhaonensis TaxID=3082863 RepID=UPI0025DE791E|nr:hypothetical protein [uncultured Lactobacillus sp.]